VILVTTAGKVGSTAARLIARRDVAVRVLVRHPHHPDMISSIPGSAEPIYGREAHGAAMQQLVRMFPDIRVQTPYPIQFGGDDWITVVTNATGTFTGEMPRPPRGPMTNETRNGR